MKDLCCVCKKSPAGKMSDIAFSHDGLKFAVEKDDVTCANCTKKLVVAAYKEAKGNRWLMCNKNGVQVDWGSETLAINMRDEARSHPVIDVFEALNILSLDPKNRWVIEGEGVNLNPRPYGFPLYFTHRNDAVTYARKEYSHTLYHWMIYQMANVIRKEEVLKD